MEEKIRSIILTALDTRDIYVGSLIGCHTCGWEGLNSVELLVEALSKAIKDGELKL